MKNRLLLVSFFTLAICCLITSCGKNYRKLILGQWYCSNEQWGIEMLEFEKDGILRDSDGETFEYQIIDNDLIITNSQISMVMKIRELSKTTLLLQTDGLLLNLTRVKSDDEPLLERGESRELPIAETVVYDASGHLDEEYESPEEHCEINEYYSNGQKKEETYYRDGRKYKTIEYFEDGKVHQESDYDKNGNFLWVSRKYGPDQDGNGYYLIYESTLDEDGNGYTWTRENDSQTRATNFSTKTTYVNFKPVSAVESKLINGKWVRIDSWFSND